MKSILKGLPRCPIRQKHGYVTYVREDRVSLLFRMITWSQRIAHVPKEKQIGNPQKNTSSYPNLKKCNLELAGWIEIVSAGTSSHDGKGVWGYWENAP